MNRLTGPAVALFALALAAGSAFAAKEKSTLKATVDPAYWDRKITKIGLLERRGRTLIVKDLARLAALVEAASGE